MARGEDDETGVGRAVPRGPVVRAKTQKAEGSQALGGEFLAARWVR